MKKTEAANSYNALTDKAAVPSAITNSAAAVASRVVATAAGGKTAVSSSNSSSNSNSNSNSNSSSNSNSNSKGVNDNNTVDSNSNSGIVTDQNSKAAQCVEEKSENNSTKQSKDVLKTNSGGVMGFFNKLAPSNIVNTISNTIHSVLGDSDDEHSRKKIVSNKQGQLAENSKEIDSSGMNDGAAATVNIKLESEKLFEAVKEGSTTAVERIISLIQSNNSTDSDSSVKGITKDNIENKQNSEATKINSPTRPETSDGEVLRTIMNTVDLLGRTVLSYACEKGHTEIVKILLDHGADTEPCGDGIHAVDFPIMYASLAGHTEIIELILGANLPKKSQDSIKVKRKSNIDVLLCYRTEADYYHAQYLAGLLTDRGLKVVDIHSINQYLDVIINSASDKNSNQNVDAVELKNRIFDGDSAAKGNNTSRNSERESVAAVAYRKVIDTLVRTKMFVPILSRKSINHNTIDSHNFGKFTPTSLCDLQFLMYRLALEFQSRGFIGEIFPVLVGDVNEEKEMESMQKIIQQIEQKYSPRPDDAFVPEIAKTTASLADSDAAGDIIGKSEASSGSHNDSMTLKAKREKQSRQSTQQTVADEQSVNAGKETNGKIADSKDVVPQLQLTAEGVQDNINGSKLTSRSQLPETGNNSTLSTARPVVKVPPIRATYGPFFGDNMCLPVASTCVVTSVEMVLINILLISGLLPENYEYTITDQLTNKYPYQSSEGDGKNSFKTPTVSSTLRPSSSVTSLKENAAKGGVLRARSVASVLSSLIAKPGMIIEGKGRIAFRNAADAIVNILLPPTPTSSRGTKKQEQLKNRKSLSRPISATSLLDIGIVNNNNNGLVQAQQPTEGSRIHIQRMMMKAKDQEIESLKFENNQLRAEIDRITAERLVEVEDLKAQIALLRTESKARRK